MPSMVMSKSFSCYIISSYTCMENSEMKDKTAFWKMLSWLAIPLIFLNKFTFSPKYWCAIWSIVKNRLWN